jgi:hypothetical protein
VNLKERRGRQNSGAILLSQLAAPSLSHHFSKDSFHKLAQDSSYALNHASSWSMSDTKTFFFPRQEYFFPKLGNSEYFNMSSGSAREGILVANLVGTEERKQVFLLKPVPRPS